MEPIIEPGTVIVIYADVSGVKQIDGQWFALFEGSWEWLNMGIDPPPFDMNDAVKITIEKVSTHAQSSRPSE